MNIYQIMNKEQIKLLEETGSKIENKDYNAEEIKYIQNNVASYIFSKSKNEISQEVNRFSEVLRKIDN